MPTPHAPHAPHPSSPRALELGRQARRRRARARVANLGERGALELPKLTDERTRAYLYRIVAAAIPLLILAGVITGEDAAVWLGLASAVLGLGGAGLATANTTTKPDQ